MTELDRAQTRLLILIALAVAPALDAPGAKIGSSPLAQRIVGEVASLEGLLGAEQSDR